jgi:acyl carrier protein
MTSIRQTILATLAQVQTDRGRTPSVPQDSDRLTQTLGFDSLDLAVIVVRLEQQLGCDPFREGRPLVATFGELVALYEREAEGDA